MMKVSVIVASSRPSAISFGVFWRFAPSTSAIIRSRKLWPGSAVMRTTISSDNTIVPPITLERSVPASRSTGADSPVTADSLIVATPSMISPSAGTCSPADTMTRSPIFRSVAEMLDVVRLSPLPANRRATRSFLARRNEAAWPRPRASATASAKFANNTVTTSSPVTAQPVAAGDFPKRVRPAVTMAPSQTTAITVFLNACWGASLTNEAMTAAFMPALSRSDALRSRAA